MTRGILHVGMPKTGTTSIQETLFFDLDDPRFLYVSAGDRNAALALGVLCADAGPPRHLLGAIGNDPAFVDRLRRSYSRRLERGLRKARERGRQPVISAEDCWRMSEREFRKVRSLVGREDLEIQVVAYLRPWKEWIESNFQQRCQLATVYGRKPWAVGFAPTSPDPIDYRARIETLDRVFGRENVLVRKFEPRGFPGGDVVRDFCHQVGISIAESRTRRTNDSLSLAATKFLVAYGRSGNREPDSGRRCPLQHGWLVRRLQELPGPPLRLHSSVVEPILAPVLPQLDWLEGRLGASMREDLGAHDDAHDTIRSDEDLLRFSGESLRWLARLTGGGSIAGTSGEETARQVGERVHRLRHSFPGAAILGRSARAAAERSWTRWTKGA